MAGCPHLASAILRLPADIFQPGGVTTYNCGLAIRTAVRLTILARLISRSSACSDNDIEMGKVLERHEAAGMLVELDTGISP